jgi:PAS domain S-box-containing protein
LENRQEKNPFERMIRETGSSIRKDLSDIYFKAGIVGGGKICYSILKILEEIPLTRLKMEIAGVVDINPDAPGITLAREKGLFTSNDYHDLFNIEGLNLIIELTGSLEVVKSIVDAKPTSISFLDHFASLLLWGLLQNEVETESLEKKFGNYISSMSKKSKLIPDYLPYRIMVINMDKSIETVNKTFLDAYHLTEDNAYGKHCYEIDFGLCRNRPCTRENGRCYIDLYMDEIRGKGIYSTIEEYVDANNRSRFEVVTLTPIYNDRGEIVQILEASRDVTEKVRLEQEAQKSNTFLQNVIQSTVDGIIVVNQKGKILLFNEGMERLTGFKAEEMVKNGHISNFCDMETARENLIKMRSGKYGPKGKLNPTSWSIKTKTGEEIPVTLSASIIVIDGKEVGSVGVFTDMREILEMRKNLEEAHFQLVRSEKIASIGRMAAGVAHEINNPLSGIMIYAELIKKNLMLLESENRQNIEDIQEIIDQTLRCKKIVSDLLEFSRQTVGKFTSFNLAILIDKSLNLLINQPLFQNVDIIKEIDANMPSIAADMGQLQQVFTNLFINAADAMEGKGQLKINVRFDYKREYFIIKVADTGPGIPDELKEKIFEIFFTTKPVGKGTGLGLSITKNILQLHGGSITVDSEPGKGTEFTIELPMGFVDQQKE